MSATAEAPSRNGDGPKRDPIGYRGAVKASMKKYEVGANGVARRVTPSEKEVDQFLIECRLYDLEPLGGQMYAVWENGSMRAVATIDGMRLLAERTGLYEGQNDPEWCDAEGSWTDYWAGEDVPLAARVRVHRKGAKVPTTGTANWHDFAPKGDAGADSLWNRAGGKPAHMLSIRAEALALRKAFPAQLSGLYTAEELGISLAAIGGGEEGGASAAIAVDVPTASTARGAPAPPRATPPVADAPLAGPSTSAPEAPAPKGHGAEVPSVIVDAAEGQPSGAPARPATKRTLAQALADGQFERLRGDLTETLFDQMPDRLTDEQSSELATALAEAEEAGITAVELERNCKVALKQGKGNVEVRARALRQWISERHQKAKAEAERAAALPEAAMAEAPGAEEPCETPSLLAADPGPEKTQ